MKKIFAFIAVLSLLMTGCEGFELGQGGKIEDIISAIDLAKLDGVSGEGGSFTIPFKPQFDYEVYANKEWISVSPEVGTSTDEFLTITISRNETGAPAGYTMPDAYTTASFATPASAPANFEDMKAEDDLPF